MKLQELLKNIEPVQIIGDADVEVSGVNIDSRKIKEGHLFVAMKGTQVDGHKFIPKALELGAKSVLCEDMPEEKVEGVTYIQVASTEDAVGKVATLFYGDPSRKLKLVGVTGTNGKTTIATLVFCTMIMPFLSSALVMAKAVLGSPSKNAFLALR
jgi:UDP-N-acetylmuramoyl-L-alanyl-D-glutamate--2,6-diaminopimelate ligase